MKAKKSLGQNFLIDNGVISKIVTEVSASNDDLIIEIGPGRGALTKLLKEKNAVMRCYEVDNDLKEILSKLEDDKTRIIWKDFLISNIKEDMENINYSKLYIVGNLPYYITTPIIEHIIESSIDFEKLVIMVQKEVADRFLAKVHSKEYGYITVVLNYFFDMKRVVDVSRYAFRPVPKVESTVLSLVPREKEELDYEAFKKFLKDCFRQKRKTLKNNLNGYDWDKVKRVLDANGMLDSIRAEELSLEMFINIFMELRK